MWVGQCCQGADIFLVSAPSWARVYMFVYIFVWPHGRADPDPVVRNLSIFRFHTCNDMSCFDMSSFFVWFVGVWFSPLTDTDRSQIN